MLLDGMQASPDLLLSQKAEQLCKVEGINYKGLEPIQRLFLTHYRCPICKLLPLYHLNLMHLKRVRCGKCGNLISFTSSGKYGRLRHLLSGKHRTSDVSKISAKSGSMQNGIAYCVVQVSFANGGVPH